jgi:hypothetical protein
MDKQQERELHKAIDSVLSDNLSPVVSKPGIIGLRELILDAIEGAGFGVVGPPTTPVTSSIKTDYNKTADACDWDDTQDLMDRDRE